MPVVITLVEDYNPVWPSWFEQLKARLDGVLIGIPHTIEHVGSTAVPGMTAKPIIDMVIVVEAGASLPSRRSWKQSDTPIMATKGFQAEKYSRYPVKKRKRACLLITCMSVRKEIRR